MGCTSWGRRHCAAHGREGVAYGCAGLCCRVVLSGCFNTVQNHQVTPPQEPSAGCDDERSCARAALLQTWYTAAEGAYLDAQAMRRMKTDSAVFNTFIFCQMFNMVNARRPHGEVNVLHGLHRSRVFLAVCVVVLVGQVRHCGSRSGMLQTARRC